jgi:hypothetical protein
MRPESFGLTAGLATIGYGKVRVRMGKLPAFGSIMSQMTAPIELDNFQPSQGSIRLSALVAGALKSKRLLF